MEVRLPFMSGFVAPSQPTTQNSGHISTKNDSKEVDTRMRMSVAFSAVAFVIVSLGFASPQSNDKANAPTAPEFGGDTNIEIFRVQKQGRTPPRRKKVLAPLLSMQWWLLIRNRDCHAQEVDPNAIFVTDDQLRIGSKVNQSGHLYIILNVQDSQEAILVFPEPRVNRGRNQVIKN